MTRDSPTASTADESDTTETNTADENSWSRTYLHVQPTDAAIRPTAVETAFQQLHGLRPTADRSRLDVLFDQADDAPLIECLLCTPGEDITLHYYFGIDPDTHQDTLARVLHDCFPDAYEIERTDASPFDDLPIPHPTPDETAVQTAGVEFVGSPDRPADWQTTLTPFETFHTAADTSVPLATLVETMADLDVPVVYQALLRPKPDWHGRAEHRRAALEQGADRGRDTLIAGWLDPPAADDTDDLPPSAVTRLDELDAKNARTSFTVNARAVALAPDDPTRADRAANALATTLSHVGHTGYAVRSRVHDTDSATDLLTAISHRAFTAADYDSWRTRLPWHDHESAGIVADPSEVGSFCILGGSALTAEGSRAVASTPDEQAAVTRPPLAQLDTYRTAGLTLGRPLTHDGTPDDTAIALPPTLQPLHLGWFGKTGSGKSTAGTTSILHNHAATAGADILFEPKGGSMVRDYLRAHYATYGSLENVYYFDCAETLPALSFFDIRDQLEAGIDRPTAVADTVDHYLELLRQVMGRDRFDRAVRAPDIIRYLVKALFDPVHGHDAFTHRELEQAAAQMHQTQDAPAVSDDDLARMLGGVAANSKRSFDELMQGVANRIEKIPADERLARVFNHVPAADDDPVFDFRTFLDENAVVIFDLGDLRPEAQRVLTLVLLSNLWTALRRRYRADESQPLVNLHLEEAASVAVSDILGDLLAQGREFNLAVTLAMQFPGQLRAAAPDAYAELLNNISTIVTGNVAVDDRFAQRFATADMDPQTVGNRLRALSRGQWLVSLPAPFTDPEPRPFLLESHPLPPGHPEGDQPLTADETDLVEAAITRATARTRTECGLPLADTAATTDTDAASDTDTEATAQPESWAQSTLDTALPLTQRFPDCVTYDAERHVTLCGACSARYAPTIDGMRNAIACCHDRDAVDRADVPIHALHLKLSATERADAAYSDRQLAFLQAVYNAHQRRYDALEYDIVHDSMLRLQEYVGLDEAGVQALCDDGVLRKDGDNPHRLFTVTASGRQILQEGYREGIHHGDTAGDLGESSQHVLAVEVGRRYIASAFVDTADSAAVSAVSYHPVGDGRRLDAAGLDADGEVVVGVEAERRNHDLRTGVPADYDTMAACDPDEAIWITMGRDDAHDIVAALHDPTDGEPRIDKTYSGSTPPRRFSLDAPGCTDVHTLRHVRDTLLNET